MNTTQSADERLTPTVRQPPRPSARRRTPTTGLAESSMIVGAPRHGWLAKTSPDSGNEASDYAREVLIVLMRRGASVRRRRRARFGPGCVRSRSTSCETNVANAERRATMGLDAVDGLSGPDRPEQRYAAKWDVEHDRLVCANCWPSSNPTSGRYDLGSVSPIAVERANGGPGGRRVEPRREFRLARKVRVLKRLAPRGQGILRLNPRCGKRYLARRTGKSRKMKSRVSNRWIR